MTSDTRNWKLEIVNKGNRKLETTFKHRCLRCGETWETGLEKPQRCGVCGSRLWGTPRARAAGGGRPGKGSGVYALVFGGRLKVGYAVNLKTRLAAHATYLRGNELLGVIPGPRALEVEVHEMLSGREDRKLDWFEDTQGNRNVLARMGLSMENVPTEDRVEEISEVECSQCGYRWIPRHRPKQCPGCKSPAWDREKGLAGRAVVDLSEVEGYSESGGPGPEDGGQLEREEPEKIRVTKPATRDAGIKERQLVTEEDGVEFSQDRRRKGKAAAKKNPAPINKVPARPVKKVTGEDLF